jgi:putative ABC transport system permease protein
MNVLQMIGRSVRTPGFALAVVLLTAAVVAVNATVFAAVWAIHYKALPYADGDRLVALRVELRNFGFKVGLSPSLREQLTLSDEVYEGVAGRAANPLLRSDDAGREWHVQRVTPDFTQVLGVTPAQGRGLLDEDAIGEARVVLLSDAAWRNRFAADPQILGQALVLGEERFTIVGVMPAGFAFPDRRADAWVPYIASASERAQDAGGNVGNFEVVARLAPGVTLAQASDRLAAVLAGPDNLDALRSTVGLHPVVRAWRDGFADEHGRVLVLLQLASVILLAVVAASLANLVLDRMLARQRDLSICRALGAGDRDIVRAVLGDLVPPVAAGAMGGLLLVPAGVALLQQRGLIPSNMPVNVGGDMSMWLAAAMAAGLVVMVALVAAMSVPTTASSASGLGVRQQAGGLGRARATMLVIQLVLATVLLGASALLLRSALNLLDEPRGFDERGVLMTGLDPAGVTRGRDFDDARDRERFAAGLLQVRSEVQALPGVRDAAYASMAPFSSWEAVSSLRVPGIDGDLQARSRSVGTGYFSALTIPFLAGRDFVDADLGDASPVIVDELFVKRWLGGRDPLSTRIDVPTGPDTMRSAQIVGVVGTVKHESLDEVPTLPTVYTFQPVSLPTGLLVTRVDGDRCRIADRVRAIVLAQFPDAVIALNQPMSAAIARTLTSRRAAVESVSAFAIITVLLVALGLYAVLSFSVRRRTAELGVRMALGASAGAVQRMVLRQGGLLSVLGVSIGLALGIPLARLIADRLYGIAPHDVTAWLLTAAIALAVALVACWSPARRASRTSPLVALKSSGQS